MSHEVETMAYHGAVPWHGLGTDVDHLMTANEALRYAGLDWRIVQKPLYIEGPAALTLQAAAFDEVPGVTANVRDSDGTVMGIVTKRYKVVQNDEAFNFTDEIVGNSDAHYETAGALNHGKRVWMMLRMPTFKILDDYIDNYLVVTNTHDGKGSLKAALTPTRVVCANTLTLSLEEARRTWSVRHTGEISKKLAEAQRALEISAAYARAMTARAEEMASKHVSRVDVVRMLDILYPIDPEASVAILARREIARNVFFTAWNQPDLANFRDTAWGVYNAVADVESHKGSTRSSATFQQNKFKSFIDGNSVLATTQAFLEEAAA